MAKIGKNGRKNIWDFIVVTDLTYRIQAIQDFGIWQEGTREQGHGLIEILKNDTSITCPSSNIFVH